MLRLLYFPSFFFLLFFFSPSLETCTTLYVAGPAAGVYLRNGDYGGRGDYFSGNSAWNMYWTFYAGKPVNRNRFRRGLSVPDRGGGGDRWSEEYGEIRNLFRWRWCAALNRRCLQELLKRCFCMVGPCVV